MLNVITPNVVVPTKRRGHSYVDQMPVGKMIIDQKAWSHSIEQENRFLDKKA